MEKKLTRIPLHRGSRVEGQEIQIWAKINSPLNKGKGTEKKESAYYPCRGGRPKKRKKPHPKSELAPHSLRGKGWDKATYQTLLKKTNSIPSSEGGNRAERTAKREKPQKEKPYRDTRVRERRKKIIFPIAYFGKKLGGIGSAGLRHSESQRSGKKRSPKTQGMFTCAGKESQLRTLKRREKSGSAELEVPGDRCAR